MVMFSLNASIILVLHRRSVVVFLALPTCMAADDEMGHRVVERRDISVANIQNPFSVHLVKNELWAFSESLGPLLSIPPPVMTVAGL